MPKTLYIIDGHAQIYRAFYALEGLTAPDGRPVNAIFQFTRMLIHLIKEKNPDYLIVVFDAPGKNFRHKMFPEYKANRKPTPPDLKAQIPAIIDIVEKYNIPTIAVPDYEADDIIGALSKKASSQSVKTVIVSGDKDLAQLLDENVSQYDPRKNKFTTLESFTEENGFGPEKLVDLMGLWGDTADNIPGVAGIGQKIGRELIIKYKTLEDLLDRAGEIKGKRGEVLLKSKEVALLSKKLATIDLEAPCELDLEAAAITTPDYPALHEIFQDLGFKALLKELEHEEPVKKEERDYQLINTPQKFDFFMKALKDVPHFALDTETTSINPMLAELVGISISWSNLSAFYLPFKAPEGEETLSLKELEWLKPIIEDRSITKTGQNIKYDSIVLRRHGVNLQGVKFDSLIASSLISAHLRGHDLDTLAGRYLGLEKIPTKDILGTGKKEITMDQADLAKVSEYACEDADVTLRLENALSSKMGEEEKVLMREVELPLAKVLENMQFTGIRLDESILKKQSAELEKLLEFLTAQIYELAGEEFNIASPKQLGVILFEKLDLPIIKKTKTGFSTAEGVLTELAAQGHELPKRILDFRQYTKLKNTYIDALPKMLNPETGRIHTTFSQTTTATGRLSSSSPNLQNIPVRSEKGRAIRAAFIPENGWKMLASDYSQVELRMLAHFSGDKVLQKAFAEDRDIHIVAAANVHGILEEEVTPEQRQAAKAVNFGIVYGQTAHGLSQTTDLTRNQAQMFIDSYFEQFPSVKDFINATIEQAHKDGGVRTMLGRWRKIPELSASKKPDRERGEREAVNTLLQGSAADLIKRAMLNLSNSMPTITPQARMLLQIHDELVFECPPEELDALRELVRGEMECAMKLSVPLKVDIGEGNNWLELK